MSPDEFEQHRERFRSTPLGVWSTSPRRPENQILSIHEDSLGICRIVDPGGGQTIHFTWTVHEDYCLLVRRIDEATGEADPDDDWLYLRYDFEAAGPDRIVMRLIEFGNLQGFAKPLYYHGPATPEIVEVLKTPQPAPVQTPSMDLVHSRFIPAIFWSGLLTGGGYAFCKIMEIDADPTAFLIAAGMIFIYLFFVFFREKPASVEHSEPPPEEEYSAHKIVRGKNRDEALD